MAPEPGSPPLGVHAVTFGCQMNELDTAKMLALLAPEYVPVNRVQDAHLVILNTCSVREKPEQKLYSMLGRLQRIKRERSLIVGVAGCTAQRAGAHIFQRFPAVDFVIGPDAVSRIRDHVHEARRRRVLDTRFADPSDPAFVDVPPHAEGPRATEAVTIQKGCDNRCTYCVVPLVRGPEYSRPSADVLAEIRALVDRGVREVTLLGQNVNTYGRKVRGEISFPELLHRVHEVPGLARIRFVTSHPRDLDEETIEAWRHLPRLASHLHLPVQSGSDRILRRMNRGYTAARFLDRVRRLQAARPSIRITTDFIVGFPGETEEDFEATLDLLRAVPVEQSFSFVYNPRPHTAGARLYERDPVDPARALARLQRLQTLQNTLSEQTNRELTGRVVPVLLEGRSRQDAGVLAGRTSCFRTVNVAADPALLGQLVSVRITEARPHSLRGRLEEPAR